MKEVITNESCCKTVKITMFGFGVIGTRKCEKPATHTNGTHYFCNRHSKTKRFVARIGDVGEILARFDTEKELRDNIHLFPNARMQKITKSYRKDIS
jgi:hypothetical protein